MCLPHAEHTQCQLKLSMKYKNTHGIDITLQSINRYYQYYINTPSKFNIYNIIQQ